MAIEEGVKQFHGELWIENGESCTLYSLSFTAAPDDWQLAHAPVSPSQLEPTSQYVASEAGLEDGAARLG
jgi:hypothetical protein